VTFGGAVPAISASIFHFREYEVAEVKDYLADKGIIVRKS
jgi:cyclase